MFQNFSVIDYDRRLELLQFAADSSLSFSFIVGKSIAFVPLF